MDIHLTDIGLAAAFFLLVCLLTTLPLLGGYWVGCRESRKFSDSGEPYIGVIVGAILGLLAIVLAFTFSMAASRYEERRQVILEDANDIGTTYLRADFLPEPSRSEIRAMLEQYVDIRLRIRNPDIDATKLIESVELSEEILDQIWQKVVIPVRQDPTPLNALFITSLNNMIDTHNKRIIVGLYSEIPLGVWIGLICLAVVALACAGYQAGTARKIRSSIMIGLVFAFAGMLTLIADLDQPRRGLLKISQIALISLEKNMDLH